METTLPGTTVYEEHQSFWLLNVIALVVAVGLVATALLSGVDPSKSRPEDLASIAAALVLAIGAMWGFSRLNIAVTTTDFRFGFLIWHRRVPADRVQVGEIAHIPMWYGIGLHFVGGQWVYNAKLGRGVQVVINGRRYLIGSDNPERLQAALLQVAPRRSKA
ncbi:MAG TPA: hypothetical protein VGL38_05610 [bacterium]|jgi:hypothetical protein